MRKKFFLFALAAFSCIGLTVVASGAGNRSGDSPETESESDITNQQSVGVANRAAVQGRASGTDKSVLSSVGIVTTTVPDWYVYEGVEAADTSFTVDVSKGDVFSCYYYCPEYSSLEITVSNDSVTETIFSRDYRYYTDCDTCRYRFDEPGEYVIEFKFERARTSSTETCELSSVSFTTYDARKYSKVYAETLNDYPGLKAELKAVQDNADSADENGTLQSSDLDLLANTIKSIQKAVECDKVIKEELAVCDTIDASTISQDFAQAISDARTIDRGVATSSVYVQTEWNLTSELTVHNMDFIPMDEWNFTGDVTVDGIEYYIDKTNKLADVCQTKDVEVLNIPAVIRVDGENYVVVSIDKKGWWFDNCTSRQINLPKTLRYIGDYGLSYYWNLISIDIPESVEQMGTYIFEGTDNLHEIRLHTSTPVPVSSSLSGSDMKKVIIPDGSMHAYRLNDVWNACVLVPETPIEISVEVADAGDLGRLVLEQAGYLQEVNKLVVKGELNSDDWSTLKSMTNLIDIDMEGVLNTSIPSSQFEGKWALERFVFPSKLETINSSAFYNAQIKTIELPKTLNRIEYSAFDNNDSIKSIDFPDNLSYIGEWAFEGCSSLQSVSLPEGLTYIGYEAFRECDLRELTIPSTLTEISDYAFSSNNNLTKINFPETFKILYSNAFSSCHSLAEIQLPEGLTDLADGAFGDCIGLTEVYLPSSLRYCDRPFKNCTNLKKIHARSVIPATTNGYCPMEGVGLSDVVLYVPVWSLQEYQLASGWSSFLTVETDDYMPQNVVIYKDFVFALTKELDSDYRPNIDLLWTDDQAADTYGNTDYQRGNLTISSRSKLAVNDFSMYLSPYAKYDEDGYSQENRNSGFWFPTAYNPTCLVVNGEMRAENVSIKTYLRRDLWQFVSFPFDVRVGDITPVSDETQWVVREYSGANRAAAILDSTWVNLSGDDVLTAGKGYIMRCYNPNSDLVEFLVTPIKESVNRQAIFNANDRTIKLEENLGEFEHNRSWNLIGNPYPSCYDTRFMDFTSPITVWNSYNSSYTAYNPADDSYILSPGEAFFVQRPLDQESITFNKTGRQTHRYARILDANEASVRANAVVTSRSVYNILLTNGESTDRTRVVINENASADYELSCDANKFMSENAQMPQIYTVNGDVRYAINERPLGNAVVELGLYIGTKGDYTILLGDNAPAGVVLEDRLNGTFTTINAVSGYTFSAAAGEQNGRFYLHFTDVTEETGIDEVSADESNNEPVYNLNGQRIDGNSAKGIVIKNGQKILRK